MSWSAQTTIPKGSTPEYFCNALEKMEVRGNEDCPEERKVAFEAALLATSAILDHGSLGYAQDHSWNIHLSGHCNPKHEKREGWANDCMTISISQGP